jgi:ATP-dependent helicase HrpB
MFPVTIRHVKPGPRRRIVDAVCEQIPLAAERDPGDMLVFLPGVGEILQTARQLAAFEKKYDWELLPLYGDLSAQEQDRVLAPSPRRKIILATNVAETSLTIDGVRIVVDSGWARVQRVDPAVGLNVLQLEPTSQASAEQRAGRAGRTAPGVCWRLWDEVTHRSRPRYTDPEILRVDLSGAALQLLCWGESDVAEFPWLTAPSPGALAQAVQLLERLDAVHEHRATPLGQQLVAFPTHPRLARLLLAGHALGVPSAAALAAAMLAERDVFDRRAPVSRTPGAPPTRLEHRSDCDITERVRDLQEFFRNGRTEFQQGVVRVGAARQVERAAGQLRDVLRSIAGRWADEPPLDRQLSQAILAAMPDRVARRREPHKPRGLMVGGRGVKLESSSSVRDAELFVCVDVDAGGTEASVRQASAIDRAWLDPQHVRQVDERFIHPTQGQVVTRRRVYWFDLLLDETPVPTPLDEETAQLLARSAQQHWHRVFPSNDKSLNSLLGRARWLGHALADPEWPDLSDAGLQTHLVDWCIGLRDLEGVQQLPWRQLIEQLLSSSQRALLAREAPETYTLPSGRVVLLSYEADRPPVLAARIQEFFGLADTPRIARGRVRLVLHLLAPNQRCQQITDDLASFWKNTYTEVRKQLRGRYPKHAWPEDPLHVQRERG